MNEAERKTNRGSLKWMVFFVALLAAAALIGLGLFVVAGMKDAGGGM